STPLPARVEIVRQASKETAPVYRAENGQNNGLAAGAEEENNQTQNENPNFLNQNLTASASWLNYKILGLALILGIGAMAGILILKKFLV
ncbi:MAG: hypothetical protein Q8L57_03890, partial [bacterium]|nr:hypothetical protein [bacterium]